MDRGWKPNVEISPNCPRCGSSNTKFCYYNNYSLTQPRYFCKGCRRYWTKGGSLRNVPVGGGCRKNRRGKSLRLSSTDHHHHRNSRSSIVDHSAIHNCNGNSSDSGGNSHIDLALVYANFLNPQPPESKSVINPSSSCSNLQELGCDFDPYSLDFTVAQLHPDSAIEEVPLDAIIHENEQFMYYGGMDSVLLAQNREEQPNNDGHKIINQQCSSDDQDSVIKNGLPPLPGEEVGSLWSNSDNIMQTSQQPPPPVVVGPESHDDPNSLLFGNWCPFDLSSDDHAFSSRT